MANPVELVLTCGSWQEAQKIADVLLEKRLAACVELLEIKSKYRWQGKIEEADEVKLIIKSKEGNFSVIKKEVTKLHSYDTFVLEQIPITKLSLKAKDWWLKETEGKI